MNSFMLQSSQPIINTRNINVITKSHITKSSFIRYHSIITSSHKKYIIKCSTASRDNAINFEIEYKKLKRENEILKRELAKAKGISMSEVKDIITDVTKTAPMSTIRRLEKKIESGIKWPTVDESPPFWTRSARIQAVTTETKKQNYNIKPIEQDHRKIYIVHVTAEMAPLAKVGGLGDVVTGLARACLARGHLVEVVLPYYECLKESEIEDLEHELDFDVPKARHFDGMYQLGVLKTSVWKGKIAGVQVFLLRPDWSDSNIFRGNSIYGGSYNEMEAYLYFCRAALEFFRISNREPNIIHLHEWHTAAVSMMYWEKYNQEYMPTPRIVFTIHNLDNSGECRQEEFSLTGISGEIFATIDKALDERTIGHNPERLNLLKGALVYSNKITTVSPSYASEILNGGAAGWLQGTISQSDIRSKFSGILNGIDIDEWDPAKDHCLPANYSFKDISGKAVCKKYIKKGLGLMEDKHQEKPLVICITRLVPQKGIHLIKRSIIKTEELGGQFILLGTGHASGDFRSLSENEFKHHPDIKLMLMYSDRLSHLMFAAADFVLVPSLFEPCGLTQMIAMRYGAIPIVRRTGGLADTVIDIDDNTDKGNGFSFEGVDDQSMDSTMTRAFKFFKKDKHIWKERCEKNMKVNFSWEKSAKSYVDLYSDIISL